MKAEIGAQYRHYKGGVYTVLIIGRLEAHPNETMVVYQSEYDAADYPQGTVWIRPIESFEGVVMVDGVTQERFTHI